MSGIEGGQTRGRGGSGGGRRTGDCCWGQGGPARQWGGDRRGQGKGRQQAEERRGRQQQEEDDDGRPKRIRARGVRYGEEQMGWEKQGAVQKGVTVYCPHKVRGKWRRYVGTVEEMIEQQVRMGHVTRAAIVQWEDQG